MASVALLLLSTLFTNKALDPNRPNFIFLLTDDQDLLFNSMSDMPFSNKFFIENGLEFTNSFISTPICCPSRTESITGRGFQNIRNGPIDCMDIAATFNVFQNPDSMFQIFSNNSYLTSSFGKLTNNMNAFWCPSDNKPTLTGFDRINCPCLYNDFYGNKYMDYYAYNDSIIYRNNMALTPSLYETSMVGNASIQYLTRIISNKSITKPFMSWIGVHAPHYPATPAAWYINLYTNATAPRTPNFNLHTENHHDFVSTNPAFDNDAISFIDILYRDRARSLMSVDDLMRDLVALLTKYEILNNTYIIFSSDHGYHLGQWRIPCAKMQLYETDIRIPTFIYGPNIHGNTKSHKIVSNVDFLPTMLDLAGVGYEQNTYDGMSWVKGAIIEPYKQKHKFENISKWRDVLLIQYGGNPWITDFKTACPVWIGTSFPGKVTNPPCCNDEGEAWMTNDRDGNNWRAIRILNDTMDIVYAEFVTDMNNLNLLNQPSFIEYYEIDSDPYQIDNLYQDLDENTKTILHDLLVHYAMCHGTSCW